jgi:hypothetical protein
MAKLPTPDRMKARFWELKKQRDAQRAKADPIRAERDKLVKKHAAELAKVEKRMLAAENGLGEMDQEMAMLVRAVGGRMGEPE